ncbi:L-2-hydroxyglutarate oxidase [Naasia sp. SYSU D00948]|uniref:L-2-hydroxyglutarate oxidase n=1 Tax=Naasia sp. SYSU D00948 TaxID=2817379 RepID=UPI001B30EAD2|nr:L-2-hydroxyglutarate oxidase [Naasia sp. SYSU D00948]
MKVVVVGAGIVGLAVARALAERGDEVTVLEKETAPARHQTGRNSGVIHSGIYYKPGSAKAEMCVAGARSMYAFAEEHGIAVERTGKLIVATDAAQIPQLEVLEERGRANGVTTRLLSPEEAAEYEPHVRCVAALRVEETGIVDYVGVSRTLAELTRAAGGSVRLGAEFVSARERNGGIVVRTATDEIAADALVNCAGLHSDRVAAASGLRPRVRIVPFRGEYFELAKEREDLVKGLIYPVPDPRFPFLGVHLTKMIGGGVHAGPNAVFAFSREGYRWRDISPKDLLSAGTWPGLWKLGLANLSPAAMEVRRSLSARLFAADLSRLVPGISAGDLHRAPAGVRAQAINRDGSLVDDFAFQTAKRQVHVLNAPSPAATSALVIADSVVRKLDDTLA